MDSIIDYGEIFTQPLLPSSQSPRQFFLLPHLQQPPRPQAASGDVTISGARQLDDVVAAPNSLARSRPADPQAKPHGTLLRRLRRPDPRVATRYVEEAASTHPSRAPRHRRLPRLPPPSAALLLPRIWTNLRLRDHAISPPSSDYPRLLLELSGAGLFARTSHTTLALLSAILALLLLSVANVVLHDGCAFQCPPHAFPTRRPTHPLAPLRVRCARRSSLPWCPSDGAIFPHGATLPGSVTEATDEPGHLACGPDFAFQRGKLVFPHVPTWLSPHFSSFFRGLSKHNPYRFRHSDLWSLPGVKEPSSKVPFFETKVKRRRHCHFVLERVEALRVATLVRQGALDGGHEGVRNWWPVVTDGGLRLGEVVEGDPYRELQHAELEARPEERGNMEVAAAERASEQASRSAEEGNALVVFFIAIYAAPFILDLAPFVRDVPSTA
ncbi:hypothetical protein Fmac_005324 [Flemingia macrophylla]|uniref:Uncharacterized protein n=1 Tax=Flemingia macrophylla TaxID=520843 RepID=A0ABD1N7K9_9FABA